MYSMLLILFNSMCIASISAKEPLPMPILEGAGSALRGFGSQVDPLPSTHQSIAEEDTTSDGGEGVSSGDHQELSDTVAAKSTNLVSFGAGGGAGLPTEAAPSNIETLVGFAGRLQRTF